ncbi:MAG: HAMP domain-containing histidine kinase, partial [Gammaproteobacteria bacterium]|nr:HAMP domain-containing histidine kinase [Gammaproteobacteria bacterium]
MNMEQISVRKSQPNVVFFIIGWGLFVTLYLTLKSQPFTHVYAGWSLFIFSSILQLVIVGYLYRIWQEARGTAKLIFGLYLLACSLDFLAAQIYHVIYDVLHIAHATVTGLLFASYNVPFLGFIGLQFLALFMLLWYNYKNSTKKGLFILFPIILIVITCCVLFFLIYYFQVDHSHSYLDNTFNVIEMIFTVGGFVVALLCLATAKHRGIFYLAFGYLILVTADLMMDFNVFQQGFGVSSFFETAWSLSYILFIYGLLTLKKTDAHKDLPQTWMFSLNSIRSQLAFWTFAICIVAFMAFLGFIYLSVFSNSLFLSHNQVIRVLPVVLIICSIFTVIISSTFSKKLCAPFYRLEELISCFMANKLPEKLWDNEAYALLEFNSLESFVSKAFTALKEKTIAEKRLLELATQIRYDISAPLAALHEGLESAVKIEEKPRTTLKNATNRISAIADNLLTKYQDVVSDVINAPLAPILLNPLIENLIVEKRAQFNNKKVNFYFNVTDNAHELFVAAQTEPLQRVFSNIINNAVEAFDAKLDQGVITISLSKVGLGNEVIVEIVDNGCGIAPELLGKIKERGFSAGKVQGSGLGLSYAIQQITDWDGSYDIESKQGVGSKFTIRLPIASQVDLILVDDDPMLTTAWQDAARACGHKIAVFNNVDAFKTALSNYAKHTLIYIDSNLSNGIKGEELAKEIYEQGFDNIYLATGYSPERFRNMTWLKGVVDKV